LSLQKHPYQGVPANDCGDLSMKYGSLFPLSARAASIVVAALLALNVSQCARVTAEAPLASVFTSSLSDGEECADEERCSYGPCDCEPRGTLLQWSYGTSFSGGPDLDEPLVTDRPDFTEASVTVGRGVLQIEAGYTYAYDRSGVVTHSYPECLFRYGIFAEWLELRIGQSVAGEDDGLLINNSGAEDLYLGLKIGLTPQEGWLPEMAIVPQMTLPTGHDDFSDDQVLPGVNWLYGWDINDVLSTAGSTQFNSTVDEGSDRVFTEWAQSWTVGYSLTEQLGAYTEWFAFFPQSADTAKPEHYFNGGFTYLLTDNIQWDIRAGVGLNSAADDYFVGSGLSVRIK